MRPTDPIKTGVVNVWWRRIVLVTLERSLWRRGVHLYISLLEMVRVVCIGMGGY